MADSIRVAQPISLHICISIPVEFYYFELVVNRGWPKFRFEFPKISTGQWNSIISISWKEDNLARYEQMSENFEFRNVNFNFILVYSWNLRNSLSKEKRLMSAHIVDGWWKSFIWINEEINV